MKLHLQEIQNHYKIFGEKFKNDTPSFQVGNKI